MHQLDRQQSPVWFFPVGRALLIAEPYHELRVWEGHGDLSSHSSAGIGPCFAGVHRQLDPHGGV